MLDKSISIVPSPAYNEIIHVWRTVYVYSNHLAAMYALNITCVVCSEAQYIQNKRKYNNGVYIYKIYKSNKRTGTIYKSIIKGNPAQADFSGRKFIMHGILS